MEDSNSLYIPLGLKEKNELWDGFGKEEAIKALIFNIFTGIIDALIYFSTKNLIFCVVFILVSVGGSIMMLTKDTTNLSVVDQIRNMLRFAKSQKYYPYKYRDEWS
ncbi:MAG: hypothetical protein M0Q14_04705 [Tissierellaceae bacterium]|jgi:hypothetical protein|nr:hypothetical protein [Tissierellaceae bacterium]